ncbi:MAG: VWA domain-containing protein [Candidatus Dormibacteraeota bacterium]|nr:VWA domain-containing protein [Candidatus Dormibacteraeota bacterium]
MSGGPFPSHRFSAWDGSQEPLGPELDELFDKLSEDVFHGWDFETALRRMLSQGWRDAGGRRLMGLEEMTERLQRRRRQQLEKFNLDNVFSDITEKLDNVLRREREGIDERVRTVEDETAKRILERVAAKRREQLADLPADPAGAIRELQQYEFMDQGAQEAFQALLEEIKKQVVDAHFSEMTQQMQAMSKQDVGELRAMAKDLNRLVREKLESVPDAQRQSTYQAFLKRWGHLFPNAPATVDQFLDEITRQMARMDSLMRSLSPEMRSQLSEMIDAVFGDDAELQAQLAELGAGLEMLSPRGGLGSRYSFFGDESLPMDEAMQMMGRLQAMEELERSLREVYRGGEMSDAIRGQLREQLGDEAARSLDQLSQMAHELEQRGLVERHGDGMRLTARGMRRIGQKALGDLFARLHRDRFGEHTLARRGQRGERADDTKPYEFGDPFDLDVEQTVMNSLHRTAAESPRPSGPPRLHPDDFEVYRSDSLTRSSTVLMLDMSRSMPLRGYFYAAKKVALALDSLIRSQYPRDSLHIIGFSDRAREISSADLPHLSVNEYVYGTNMQHGLMLARRMLARDGANNKQIIIVSDGEPTAHMEDGVPVFFYPPLPETFQKTLLEVHRCTRENIVINTFMLESNHQLVRFVNEMTRLNRGRAFFISPDRLGDYVLVDYVASKRRHAA